MYILQWRQPTIDLNKATPINVNVGSVNSTAASITFTGKGAANYGFIQQTNMMRLLENWADNTPPDYPTVGQLWFNSDTGKLNVCTATAPTVWESLSGFQVSITPPPDPSLGDTWLQLNGHLTGTMYVYTGAGRFPPSPWDAYVEGAYGTLSTNVQPYAGIILNYNDFLVTPNYGECYIHGYVGAVPSDTDPTINIDGTPTTMPQPTKTRELGTSQGVDNGFIVWDTTGTMVHNLTATVVFFSCRYVGLGQWEYDNNERWVPFTVQPGMYVVGTITVLSATDQDVAPGVGAAAMWQDAKELSDFTASLQTSSQGIGGWEQVWPTVEAHGSRLEYDSLLEQVLGFIGSAATFGGSGMETGLALTDLTTMDAGRRQAYLNNDVGDPDLAFAARADLVVTEPTSQDWDLLLAAARLAVSRLDLPSGYAEGISSVAFVADGLLADQSLLQLPTTDIRYPSDLRLSQRRVGSITAARAYADTSNILAAALPFRYQLRNFSGSNSTNTTPLVTLAAYTHSAFDAAYTGGASVTLQQFTNWYSFDDAQRFFTGGNTIDVTLAYDTAGPAPEDTAWNNFTLTNSRFRISHDTTRIFTSAGALSAALTGVGFQDLVAIPTFTTLAVVNLGGQTITVSGAIDAGSSPTSGSFVLRVQLTAPVGLTGTTRVTTEVQRDAATFGADVPFFQPPIAFAPADASASDPVFINDGSVQAPPVVDYTASVYAGPAPLSVDFTWTGSGLIGGDVVEWDFESDGVVDYVGNTPTFVYNTPGYYTVTVRAGQPGRHAVLQRVSYIQVT